MFNLVFDITYILFQNNWCCYEITILAIAIKTTIWKSDDNKNGLTAKVKKNEMVSIHPCLLCCYSSMDSKTSYSDINENTNITHMAYILF